MKILIVASDKNGRFAPFIEEQMAALEARGMEVLRYGITGKGIIGYLRELPALRRAIRQHHPDIIHAHYGLSGLLANLQRRVPVVTTYHGSDINLPAILRFSKIAMCLSAHNIFVSKRNVSLALGDEAMRLLGDRAIGTKDEVKGERLEAKGRDNEVKGERLEAKGTDNEVKGERLEAKGTEDGVADIPASTPYTLHPTPTENILHPTPKNTLLPCGVNLTEDQLLSRSESRTALGIAEDVKVILFAGAFDNAVKDAPLAKQAVVVLEDNINNIARKSTSLRATEDMAKQPLIFQELRGFTRAEVTRWMCAANCLLMTSKTEGSPQVVKEAMACGCPIVSVDVGDVAERTSGVEGCYVVSSREPATIAEALQKALAFEGKTNGRERIIEMQLSNEQVAMRLEEIYRTLV